MNAIVIEDEVNVRQGFIKMVYTFCPEVDVIAEADSVESGLKLLANTSCDILFLDINLPDGSGFDIIQKLPKRDFHLVFVTAYDQYAVEAFQMSAIDYLLKPVSPDRLLEAVAKVEDLRTNDQQEKMLDVLKERLEGQYSPDSKIILADSQAMHIIQIKDILYCEAQGSYTQFKLSSGKTLLVSQHLKEYEKLLGPFNFMRPHNSYLINLNHIKEFATGDGQYLVMTDESQLPVSVRKKAQLIEALRTNFITSLKK